MTVTVHIDVSTAEGRMIIKKLEKHKEIVEIISPLPVDENGLPIKTYSVDEAFENLWKKMEEHYGFDIRKL